MRNYGENRDGKAVQWSHSVVLACYHSQKEIRGGFWREVNYAKNQKFDSCPIFRREFRPVEHGHRAGDVNKLNIFHLYLILNETTCKKLVNAIYNMWKTEIA